MPLSDLQCARLLQQQYDDVAGIFDFSGNVGDVTFGLKYEPDEDVIAFEGSHNVPDWFSNFKAWMIPVPKIGKVEKGFYDGMESALIALKPQLRPNMPKRLTGHSRGAAHANMAARMLIRDGWDPASIYRVKFGEPRQGDADYISGLRGSPQISYRNYGNALDQDWVCDVPLHFMLEPYETETQTLFNQPPPADDPWMFLRRHHLFLYTRFCEGKERASDAVGFARPRV